MNFNHYSISDVGQVRQANEDFCGDKMTVNGHVIVVCDGMGGHVGGATASKIAVNSIIEFFDKEPSDNIYVGISKAFQFANEQVYGNAIAQPELKGMGTTGTVLVIRDEGCYIGHVGDSRIYIKSDGKLHRLTKDHSFVQGLVDQGIISDDDAESHPKKNQILKALGIGPEVEATVCAAPIQPKPGDTFLLCSDGLNGMIKDPVIEELIDPSSVQTSAQALIDAANNAGGTDNITASLVCISESSFATSSFKSFNPVVASVNADTIIIENDDRVAPPNGKLKWIILGVAGLAVIVTLAILFIPGGKKTKPSPKQSDQVDPKNEKDEPEKAKFYIVKDGDELKDIAKELKVTLDELLKENNLKEDDNISAGDKLVIPSTKLDIINVKNNDNKPDRETTDNEAGEKAGEKELLEDLNDGKTITIIDQKGLLDLCKCGGDENDSKFQNWKKELIKLNPDKAEKLKAGKIEKEWVLKLP
ncbi:Stp1/IreP family PP2C-type Ser/Thr phosphatase [Crocinitomicaceae bacterium]|nr:Stp1/IreP family PP2C-type Ser/Thr phosphatase [Crocinitomicaceae bacterium]